MITGIVRSESFEGALQKYRVMLGKDLTEVIKEQAKLLAKRLAELTPPKSQKQGKNAVSRDVHKVYLRSEWFTDIFQFTRNSKLGDRIQDEVRQQNTPILQDIFQNSSRLNQIRIESFEPSKHARARNARGQVSYHHPFSFPLGNQGSIEDFSKSKEANVGFAKSGWGSCLKQLGGNPPGWQSKPLGEIEDGTAGRDEKFIRMTNLVSYFSSLNDRMNIVPRAMEGRERDMIKAAEVALDKAKSKAGL